MRAALINLCLSAFCLCAVGWVGIEIISGIERIADKLECKA